MYITWLDLLDFIPPLGWCWTELSWRWMKCWTWAEPEPAPPAPRTRVVPAPARSRPAYGTCRPWPEARQSSTSVTAARSPRDVKNSSSDRIFLLSHKTQLFILYFHIFSCFLYKISINIILLLSFFVSFLMKSDFFGQFYKIYFRGCDMRLWLLVAD